MDVIETLTVVFSLIYDLLLGFFSTLGPSVFVSLLTAVVTVQLTFWYHDRRDRRSALRAFESEIHLNDMETEMVIHDIFGHRDGFEDDSDTRTTVRLATSGYDKMKTTGTLTMMSYNANESIRSYYTMLRLINRTLQQREDIRYNLPWSKREYAIETVDSQLLTYICTICGPRRLELVADRLNENEEVEQKLREQAEQKSGRGSGGTPIFGDYDEVSYYLTKELTDLRIFPRWKDMKKRLGRK